MCGIVGKAELGYAGLDDAWLHAAGTILHHRGPDGEGYWRSQDGRVELAHRRLAIIDLSAAAGQPMERDAFCIAYNGEVYNFTELRDQLIGKGHVFRTQSDTEVLLAAWQEWGVGCLDRLNGMFAFALYDANGKALFLARDRAGEKPLFYRFAGGVLSFASELKALMADPSHPRVIDEEAFDCYLAMGFAPGDRCILSGFKKLPPAHALRFDLATGALDVWRYWRLPPPANPESSEPLNEASLVDELETLLADAVRRQMTADVPVGVLLSGGIDSSIVTAMAVRAQANIKTFTIRFPGHGRLDETEHARLISRHFATEHIEFEATAPSQERLTRLARQFDEPIIDSSMIPTSLVTDLVGKHCTVAVGGDGADELFGGYSHYDRMLRMERKFSRVPLPLRKAIALGAERLLPIGAKGRNWLQALGEDLDSSVPLVASYFDAATRRQLLGRSAHSQVTAEMIFRTRARAEGDLLQRASRTDFENYLPEDILVKVDRSSMLSSLEMRAPFLDCRIIEFASGKVPSSLKATSSERKILLRRLAARLLPRQFDQTRKQGFSIPIAHWLESGPMRELFYAVLLDQGCIFDQSVVRDLLDSTARGRNNGERLFGLLLFELWRKEYRVEL